MAARTALQPWVAELGPRAELILALVSGGAEAGGGRFTASGVVGDLLVFFAALSAKAPSGAGYRRLALGRRCQSPVDGGAAAIERGPARHSGQPTARRRRRMDFRRAAFVAGAVSRRGDRPCRAALGATCRPLHGGAHPQLCRRRAFVHRGAVPFDFCRKSAVRCKAADPGWVATLVASRLAPLPPEQVNVVRAAAVIGNTVPNWLLVSACGGAPDQATVRALADADFLYAAPAAGGLRFKHGITKDAVYESIGLRERQAFTGVSKSRCRAFRTDRSRRYARSPGLPFARRGPLGECGSLCRTRRR